MMKAGMMKAGMMKTGMMKAGMMKTGMMKTGSTAHVTALPWLGQLIKSLNKITHTCSRSSAWHYSS
jgi:hypothetical protein